MNPIVTIPRWWQSADYLVEGLLILKEIDENRLNLVCSLAEQTRTKTFIWVELAILRLSSLSGGKQASTSKCLATPQFI